MSAAEVAQVLYEVFWELGFPKIIQCDMDLSFAMSLSTSCVPSAKSSNGSPHLIILRVMVSPKMQ
jgi:hypothetical protein